MLARTSQLISRHAGLVFLGSSLLGLVVPGLELVPPWIVLALVGTVIFLACFKTDPAELKGLSAAHLALFYAWRFLVLPVLAFLLASELVPERAAAVLVLALMPPAVATPGLAAILGGHVALSLALLVGGTLLTPLVVPPMVSALAGASLHVDPLVLARTLVFAVVLPIVVHVPLRRFERFRSVVVTTLGTASVVLISVSMALVTAQRRAVILGHPGALWASLGLATALYVVFYAAGLAVPRITRTERISFALSSGANNIVLGISVAVLYLSPEDGAWAVICLVPWSLFMIPLRRLRLA